MDLNNIKKPSSFHSLDDKTYIYSVYLTFSSKNKGSGGMKSL